MSDSQLEEWCKNNINSENPIECHECPNCKRCDVYCDRYKHSPLYTEN